MSNFNFTADFLPRDVMDLGAPTISELDLLINKLQLLRGGGENLGSYNRFSLDKLRSQLEKSDYPLIIMDGPDNFKIKQFNRW